MVGLEPLLGWIDAALPVVMLIALRIGTAFVSMPAPFGDLAPMRIRAALTFMVAIALATPLISGDMTVEDSPHWNALQVNAQPLALFRAALGEIFAGAVIGVTVRVILAAISIAGTAVGFSSGLSFAQSVDPALGESMTPVARALGSLGIAFFLAMQGHHVVLDALAASLRAAPPGDVFTHVDFGGVVSLGSEMVAHGLRISAPVVATMFIVQLGLALTSRAAPRVQIFQLTFAVAVSSGLLLLYVASPTLAPALAAEVRSLPEMIAGVFGSAG